MNKVSQKIRKLILHARPVHCGEYSVDGAYIFTAGYDSVLNVICAYTGEVLEKYGPHLTSTGTAISAMAVSSDCRYVCLGFKAERLVVHDRVEKTKTERVLDCRGVRAMALTKDSSSLFVCTLCAEGEKTFSKVLKLSFP